MSELPCQTVTRPDELDACCAHLATCPVFGFDTEFIGEDTYHPRLCLVQVATPERLYLLDPLAKLPLDPFWARVADPAHVVVVHAGREEIRLCHLWSGKAPGNPFDLQLAAGLMGIGYPVGHAQLVNQFLKVRLDKGETLTDWARRPLTSQQVQYAFDDVRYLLPLYEQIHKRLSDLDRLDWAAEEFQSLVKRSLLDDPEVERWRKLKGLGSLDRQKLAVVRELFAWREEKAARINRPVRFILRDDLIIEIARRNPQRERDLTVLRGLPRHDLGDLIEVVERGRKSLKDNWPMLQERDNDLPQVAMVTNFLLAALGGWCAQKSLTQGLVATNNDVKLLVRARWQGAALPDDSALTRGWRSRHVLPKLLAILQGHEAIRVGDVRNPSPFDHVAVDNA